MLVGKRKQGGYECELDIVGFHPVARNLLHIEPSIDAMSWEQREQRFQKKFDAGRQYIHSLFTGLELPQEIDQRAAFVFASNKVHQTVGGGRVVHVREVLQEVFAELESKILFKNTIPEHLAILR